MNAPLILPKFVASRFGYPFKSKQEQAITDPQTFYDGLAFVQGGHYPLGVHGFFHGGVHIARASSNALSLKDDAIGCMADGEVVAYRIDRRYSDATPGAGGEGAPLRPYSVGFVLVRHRLQAPTPPQAPKPAPVENPMADRRNMGTYLYADERGNSQLAWLPQGTPLLVEVGSGQSSYVRVLDVMSPGFPKQGWINRVWLALDPLAGSGLRSVFGMKERVQTHVYEGDRPDPAKWDEYSRNQAEQAKPAPPSAPTLTLYSLYMHLADLASYEKHAKRLRPAWWPAADDKAPRLPEATDRVVTLARPVPIREGDIVGHIGEDVPARMRLNARQPASQPLLHLELFSGDDVPDYLARSRKWASEHVPDSERTLLVLRTGDTLHTEPNGAVAFTLNRPQVLPLVGIEVREVEGKRWRKVVKLSGDKGGPATGWVPEEGHLASLWEWPGFEVHDEASTAGGFRHDDAPAFATYIRQEGPRPPDSPFFAKLRDWLDSKPDGDLSEEELDWALRNRSVAGMLGRLIVRHESAWSRTYSAAQQATSLCIAEQLGPNTLQCIQEETPRAEKLPWWDEVAAGVAGFPQSSRVYHFHPGGVAGNFTGAEQLVTYLIHQATAQIERVVPREVSYTEATRIAYVYIDRSGTEHQLGTYDFITVGKRGPNNVLLPGESKLMDLRTLRNYENGNVRYGFDYDDRLTLRPYIRDLPLASLLGAMLEIGYMDISCNGFSDQRGYSIGGSSSHYDGTNGDFKYLRLDGRTQLERSLHIDLQPELMDEVRQLAFNEALYRYGWRAMLSWPYMAGGRWRMLPHCTQYDDHNHHLHVQGYRPNFSEIDR